MSSTDDVLIPDLAAAAATAPPDDAQASAPLAVPDPTIAATADIAAPAVLGTASLAIASQLTFDDEFDSFVSSPDGSVGWMTSYPYGGESARALPGNGEAEYYSDSSVGVNPFSVENGVLDITATVATGVQPYGLPYISGIATTYKSLSQTYGYFETRVELPAGQGLWPAFWLLPDSVTYDSELDAFEVLEGAPGTLYFTAHTLVNGVWTAKTDTISVADTTTSFHTYGVDWEPGTITLYIDGTAVATQATPANMNLPMYMILNLAVGAPGSWPGAPDSSTVFPATMQVDYVRAYATANTVSVSGTAAIETASVTGQVELGGVGYSGVGVALRDAAGNVAATTQTDAAGDFSFTGLAAGNDQVSYTAPAGLAFQTSGLTGMFTLADGQALALPAEVLIGTASIGGQVLLSGTARSGVTVTLRPAGGTSVSTTTDANGDFTFTGLVAGSYQVLFTAPAGDIVLAGALTAAIVLTTGQAYTLPAVNFGPAFATITGKVLYAGAAAAGVAVALEDSSAKVLATTLSGSDGAFSFGGLAPGTYRVAFTPPAGTMAPFGGVADPVSDLTAPLVVAAGQTLALGAETLVARTPTLVGAVQAGGVGQAGIAVSLLGASGAVLAVTRTDAAGAFAFSGLAAGSYRVKYTAPSGTALQTGGPAAQGTGLTQPIALASGQILALAAEPLLTNPATIQAKAQLVDANAITGDAGVSVALVDAAGTVIATDLSEANGWFIFYGIAAGTYQLRYTLPSGQGFVPGSGINAATGLTAAFAVAAGQAAIAPSAAVTVRANVSGQVVLDGHGESGVAVALLNATGTPLATARTDAAGDFTFAGLSAGSYQLQFTPPGGQVARTGGLANPATGLTGAFTLAGGQSLALPKQSFLTDPATIQSNVLHFGGATDPVWGGADVGVTVALLGASGRVLATALSNSQGWFIFRDLAAGSYQLQYTTPVGQAVRPGSGGTGLVTIAAGQNLFAPSASFISTDTAAAAGIGFLAAPAQVFALPAGGAAPATISGFDPASGDALDVTSTLAGTDILPDLSNIGLYITANEVGANTVLSVDPTGGGAAPTAVAVLLQTQVSVAQLLAAHEFVMT